MAITTFAVAGIEKDSLNVAAFLNGGRIGVLRQPIKGNQPA
jgi:hypothetical protein